MGERTAGLERFSVLTNFLQILVGYLVSGVAACVHLSYRNSTSTLGTWQEERATLRKQQICSTVTQHSKNK